MIAVDDRNCLPLRPRAVRLLQATTAAWKLKSWFCGISSMCFSSTEHVGHCICVGSTALCSFGSISSHPARHNDVKPETVVRWHRKGFDAYWQWKSRSRGDDSGSPKRGARARCGAAGARTATQAAKVRVETMDSARRQAASCARVLLTISESAPDGPTTRHMPG